MTLIIGLAHNGVAYLAGDSCASDGHTYSRTAQPKVFVNDGLLVGYTSSFRLGQLLEHVFDPPKRPKDTDPLTYMVRDFVYGLRHELKEAGYSAVRENVEEGGYFLVGLEGRIFKVQADFSVLTTPENFTAVGSGEDVALAVLHATAHLGLPPEERLFRAMWTAERMVTTVRGPFFVVREGEEKARMLELPPATSPG